MLKAVVSSKGLRLHILHNYTVKCLSCVFRHQLPPFLTEMSFHSLFGPGRTTFLAEKCDQLNEKSPTCSNRAVFSVRHWARWLCWFRWVYLPLGPKCWRGEYPKSWPSSNTKKCQRSQYCFPIWTVLLCKNQHMHTSVGRSALMQIRSTAVRCALTPNKHCTV